MMSEYLLLKDESRMALLSDDSLECNPLQCADEKSKASRIYNLLMDIHVVERQNNGQSGTYRPRLATASRSVYALA